MKKEEPERDNHWEVHWRLILEWPKIVKNITIVRTSCPVTVDAVMYAMTERLDFLFHDKKSYQLLSAIPRRGSDD